MHGSNMDTFNTTKMTWLAGKRTQMRGLDEIPVLSNETRGEKIRIYLH